MTLEPELNLSDFFSSDALVIKLEQLLTDQHRVDIVELDWKQHLAVTLKLFKHFAVTVLQHSENLLDDLKDFLFRDGGVDPLSQVVEKLLFEVLSVFLPPEVGVYRGHSFVVDVRQGFLRRTPIQIQQQQRGQVGHLPWEGDHVGILQVEFFQLVALADLHWHLA